MADDTAPETGRLRLNLMSEVQSGKPIHMLRPGTFTGMSGRPITFSEGDIAGIVERFKAGKRIKPPITENHNYGRAVGRIINLWTDATSNLYGQPRWNDTGTQLLSEEVYDGFSVELDPDETGWTLIGGSLTNYPAVNGLAPVTLSTPTEAAQEQIDLTVASPDLDLATTGEVTPRLSLPLPPLAPVAERPHTTPRITKEKSMSDPTVRAPSVEAGALPEPVINDAAMQAQMNAYVAQLEARYASQQEQAFQRAQLEFDRRISEMEQRRQIESYAQHITTPTMSRQHALPGQAETYVAFLASLSGDSRKAAMSLFDGILTSGLVSFEEIGASGEAQAVDARAEFQALVDAKVANGMARTAAIQAVSKARPELYAAQMKGGK